MHFECAFIKTLVKIQALSLPMLLYKQTCKTAVKILSDKIQPQHGRYRRSYNTGQNLKKICVLLNPLFVNNILVNFPLDNRNQVGIPY